MLILFVHSIVLLFMPFTFLICSFWFVFFKLQVPHFPPPTARLLRPTRSTAHTVTPTPRSV